MTTECQAKLAEDKYYLLENDDVNIPLKPYVPSMRLSNKGYENV